MVGYLSRMCKTLSLAPRTAKQKQNYFLYDNGCWRENGECLMGPKFALKDGRVTGVGWWWLHNILNGF